MNHLAKEPDDYLRRHDAEVLSTQVPQGTQSQRLYFQYQHLSHVLPPSCVAVCGYIAEERAWATYASLMSVWCVDLAP